MTAKITVSGNIGIFTGGTVLTTAADIANYVRTFMAEGSTDPDTAVAKLAALSDDQIVAAIEALDLEGEEPDDADLLIEDAVSKLQPGKPAEKEAPTDAEMKVQAANVSSMFTAADRIAAELDKAEHVTSIVLSDLKAAEDVATNAPRLLRALIQDRGADFVASLPRPGSEKKDVGENEPFDVYKRTESTGKGGHVEKTYFFMNEIADRTTKGREITQAINDLANGTGQYALYKDKMSAETEGGKLAQRRLNHRNMFKKALSLHYKFQDVRTYGIGADWATVPSDKKDGNGNAVRVITDSRVCIALWDKNASPPVSINMDVGKFLNLDLDKATKAGGGFDNLLATMKKKRKTSGNTGNGAAGETNKEGDKTPAVTNVNQANAVLAQLAGYLETTSAKAGIWTILNARKPDGKPADGSDDLLTLIFGTAEALGEWTSDPKLQERWIEWVKKNPGEPKKQAA